jgi:hypothetical protein
MNYIDPIMPPQKEARLRYGDGEFQMLQTGDHVRCGVTGAAIRLNDLKYWNVDKQIAYISAKIAFLDMAKIK